MRNSFSFCSSVIGESPFPVRHRRVTAPDWERSTRIADGEGAGHALGVAADSAQVLVGPGVVTVRVAVCIPAAVELPRNHRAESANAAWLSRQSAVGW
jgi:hypothetical protein